MDRADELLTDTPHARNHANITSEEEVVDQLSDVARPGIMISNTWPTSRELQGATRAAIETVLEDGFFEAFQTVEIPYPEERRAIASLLSEEGMPLTYCVTRILNENGLDLSDLDEGNRKRSYEQVIRCLEDAREAGATSIQVVSGLSHADSEKRKEGLRRLEDSLMQICVAARATPALRILVEPLDIGAHKKRVLGTTGEAIVLCEAARRGGLNLQVCLDTAHMILNGEDPIESLALAQPHVAEFHYCNAVINASDPHFGDHHLPFGPPGVVSTSTIGNYMQESLELGFFNAENRPGIFCEVLRSGNRDSLWVMRHCRETLEDAWSMQMEPEPPP
jgi:sugar phosphate isomerase/epimerase